ncbi:hypothetical protein [Ammoniphilus resinae]|uniref:Uncharacterized protein n=1 Tax=Ammoniphilus resinae TaxID=861532 RepID=A0ABS4GQ49_9BACL|nr:hypothetical protein [Ammoniphilus resinae]MBP1931990.1 hypothetical protein [Ammoniphilus resinae]
MKKTQIFICLVLLFGMGFSVHAEEDDGSRWFIYELLKFYIPVDVEQQYKAENRIYFAYITDGKDPKQFMKVSDISLDEQGRPYFLVSFKIKPTWTEGTVIDVRPNYYDRVTYQVYPALLRLYGESKGIKRFKYEKKVSN